MMEEERKTTILKAEESDGIPNPDVVITVEESDLLVKDESLIEGQDFIMFRDILKKVQNAGNPKVELTVLRKLIVSEEIITKFKGKLLALRYLQLASLEESLGGNSAASYANAAQHYGYALIHDQSAKYYEKAIEEANEGTFTNDVMDRVIRSGRREYESARDSAGSSRLFIHHCDFKRKNSNFTKKIGYGFLKYIANYGESPMRVAINALFTIVVCAIIYRVTGINSSDGVIYSCSASIYFSVVTFTTLGYGDFAPLMGIGRFVAALEAVLGLFFSSLFLVTLVRRYGR